jgi:hypothetical protein
MSFPPPKELQAIRAAKRQAKKDYQLAETIRVDEFAIRPTISRVGGRGIGWELISDHSTPDWYLATKQLCIDAIPRYRKRYP